MLLYRVFPYLGSARSRRPGHPLYVPRATGDGRIDNPDRYDVLYVGDSADGAVAEAFGTFSRWGPGLLRGSPGLPGSMRALATYELDDSAHVCDLDDAKRLVELRLRPSFVVTRDRAVTQGWASRLHDRRRYAGVRWWSYYDASWGSLGLWEVSHLSVALVEPLTLEHPAVVSAADVLLRQRG